MIDKNKLAHILAGYKAYFREHWKNENYKWLAVKHFQDHWDLEAEDFGLMFKSATARTYNLLARPGAFPKDMIINFARADRETTRLMFRDLFDESRDLAARVSAFQASSNEMLAKHYAGTQKNHYQNTGAISTYLWLRYPEKYYIYKYGTVKAAAAELSADFMPRADGSVESMLGGYALYDEICAVMMQDDEIRQMLSDVLTDAFYPDPQMKTLTVDLGFYIKNFYPPEPGDDWLPKGYNPGLSAEQWVKLLGDPSVFTPNALQIVRRMKDYGGRATCTQLSEKYGETKEFYNSGSTALAKRVAERTNCPLYTGEDGKLHYWPVLYEGKPAPREADGSYIWQLRQELSQALDRVDSTVATTEFGPPKYTKEDFLNSVYMAEDRYDVLVALLQNKLNLILQGAPGVGKTFTARRLAYAMMGEQDDSRIEVVQFHQNYTYEDFVMGYRPDGAGFKLTDGIFFRFCRTAANHPEKPYFFIIDEINRGNMSKIFGELLMLIEKDYRETEVTLAYSGEPFRVPKNLYLIGMMNTADRSLAMIDYALRRRFSFFEIEPGFSSDGFMNYQRALANETFDALIEQIKALNREIAQDRSLGKGFRIGHSYFCGRQPGDCTTEWMRSVVEFDILPMLSEYWFDEPATLQRWENNLRGVFDD